jgi:hypothetical protein
MPTKACRRCGKEKPLSDFYKNNATRDGLTYWCKDCTRTASRDYYHRRAAFERYLRNMGIE